MMEPRIGESRRIESGEHPAHRPDSGLPPP